MLVYLHIVYNEDFQSPFWKAKKEINIVPDNTKYPCPQAEGLREVGVFGSWQNTWQMLELNSNQNRGIINLINVSSPKAKSHVWNLAPKPVYHRGNMVISNPK